MAEVADYEVLLDPTKGAPSILVTFGQAKSGSGRVRWWKSDESQDRLLPDTVDDEPVLIDWRDVEALKGGDYLQVSYVVASVSDTPITRRYSVIVTVFQGNDTARTVKHTGELPENGTEIGDFFYVTFG
jgi:hypothetical protein